VASYVEMVRRTLVLVAVVVAVVALWVYLRSTNHEGGRSAGTAPAITLRAQEEGAQQGWTTTRRVSVACGTHPTVRGSESESGRSLCEALAYYASHRHASLGPTPCGPVIQTQHRVVIAGRLDGHPLRLEMGTVCNPTLALGQAVQTIHVAAFK
jgi:hypothetical protein